MVPKNRRPPCFPPGGLLHRQQQREGRYVIEDMRAEGPAETEVHAQVDEDGACAGEHEADEQREGQQLPRQPLHGEEVGQAEADGGAPPRRHLPRGALRRPETGGRAAVEESRRRDGDDGRTAPAAEEAPRRGEPHREKGCERSRADGDVGPTEREGEAESELLEERRNEQEHPDRVRSEAFGRHLGRTAEAKSPHRIRDAEQLFVHGGGRPDQHARQQTRRHEEERRIKDDARHRFRGALVRTGEDEGSHRSDGHDLLLLLGDQLVELLRELFEQLLRLRLAVLRLVLGHALLLRLLEILHRIATGVAQADAGRLGLAAHALDQLLAALLRQRRHREADRFAVVRRGQTDVRVDDRLLDRADEVFVPGLDEHRLGIGHRDARRTRHGHLRTVVLDHHAVQDIHRRLAGADIEQLFVEVLDGLLHAHRSVVENRFGIHILQNV